MKANVGGLDRAVRTVVGPALILLSIAFFVGLVTLGGAGVPAALGVYLLGSYLVVTGTLQRCPVNRRLGVDTAYTVDGPDTAVDPTDDFP